MQGLWQTFFFLGLASMREASKNTRFHSFEPDMKQYFSASSRGLWLSSKTATALLSFSDTWTLPDVKMNPQNATCCNRTGAEAHPWIFFAQKLLFILPFLYKLRAFAKGLSVRELRTPEQASTEGTRVGARRGVFDFVARISAKNGADFVENCSCVCGEKEVLKKLDHELLRITGRQRF